VLFAAALVAACGSSTPDAVDGTEGPAGSGDAVAHTGGTERSDVAPNAKPADVFETRALVGPAASIDALCGRLEQGVECDDRNAFAVPTPPAPYLDVKILTIADRDSRVAYCDIAVKLERGWFTTLQHQVCSMEEPVSGGMVTAVSYATRSGGSPVIRIQTSLNGVSGGVQFEDETVVLCGVGASGAPKCTAPVITYRYTLDDDGGEDERELAVKVLPDGTVKLAGQLDEREVDQAVPVPF
jgi:hypothetical protein